jgi:hypothetical protein
MEAKAVQSLASYRSCIERIEAAWPAFRATHADRLRHGAESEKVAEAIVEDLFTQVLDWDKGDLLYQVGYADIVLSRNLAKYLVIEVKRPGTLWPGRRTLDAAVAQARRYADEQKIRVVAATDGRFLYAADIAAGGLTDRVLVDLAALLPPHGLWRLSVHGVYRPCDAPALDAPIAAEELAAAAGDDAGSEALLHPKYKLPAPCFAYVPDAGRPGTWKLPYRLASGDIDAKRLPKAIEAMLSNYRGAKVEIPEADAKGVLLRLAQAAEAEGHMPPRAIAPAPIYRQLAVVLEQLGIGEAGVPHRLGVK